MVSKKKGSLDEHERIVKEILETIGRELHGICRAFPNPTGVAYRERPWGRQWIRYGVEGSGDIYGFTMGGRLFYCEVKSGSAKQRKNQENFQKVCAEFGVAYAVVRSSREAIDFILRLVK